MHPRAIEMLIPNQVKKLIKETMKDQVESTFILPTLMAIHILR